MTARTARTSCHLTCQEHRAVAHQIADALFDDVAEIYADAEVDAAILGHGGDALEEAVLHLDGAGHGVEHAAEFDDAVAISSFSEPIALRWQGAPAPPQPRRA